MILTVTLNPAVDRMYYVDTLKTITPHRCSTFSVNAGGKGINATKVIHALGSPVKPLGFAGGHAGAFIKNALHNRGIESAFTEIEGESRTTLSIKPKIGDPFELVEEGPTVSEKEQAEFLDHFDRELPAAHVLVISGSAPPSVPKSLFAHMLNRANALGVPSILDVNATLLGDLVRYQPGVIKPNKDELEVFANADITDNASIIESAKEAIKQGAKSVAVSLGSGGMVYVDKKQTIKVTLPSIKTLSPVGSGDATVGGLAVGLQKGLSTEETLRLANACGMSNAVSPHIGEIDVQAVETYRFKITTCSLNIPRPH